MKPLTYVSVCSGIEAVSVAWQALGFEPVHFAEIDPFCSALLDHHYPEVPNLGDITQHETWPAFDDRTRPAVLVGGTPCQSFSIAGLRGGMADARGQLTLSYLQIARRYRPRWVVWENVPGVLSADGGRALGAFLRGLGLLGYGFAYLVLDAQYFGLAQRRKRVFVVGYLGDGRRAAAVLFERESLQWYPPPSREAGQGTTYDTSPSLTASGRGVERTGESRGQDCVIPMIAGCLNSASGHAVPGNSIQDADQGYLIPTLSLCLNAGGMRRIDAESETLLPTGGFFDDPNDRIEATLRANGGAGTASLAFGWNKSANQSLRIDDTTDVLQASSSSNPAAHTMRGVRRLMPIECERLQGFPDHYTRIAYGPRKKKLKDDYLKYLLRDGTLTREECYGRASDGPRYKALGNSMAVPVLAWIGRRIQMVDAL